MTEMTGYQPSQKQIHLWKRCADGAYVTAVVCVQASIPGPRLRQAIEELTDRHEALRTRLVCEPGMALPFQIIEEDLVFAWGVHPAMSPAEARDHSLLQPAGQYPLSATLYGDEGSERLLVLRMPALCADAHSMKVIVQDMSAMLSGGHLEEEPVQYLDYSEWQHELSGQSGSVAAHRFWKQRYETTPYQPGFAIREEMAFRQAGLEISWNGVLDEKGLLARFAALLHLLEASTTVSIACHFDSRVDASFLDAVGPFGEPAPVNFSFDASTNLALLDRQAAAMLSEARPFMPYHKEQAVSACSGLVFQWQELPSISGGLQLKR